MSEVTFPVGVVVEKRAIDHPWVDHVWEPVAVLPAVPEAPAWTLLHRDGGTERYYMGAADVLLAVANTAQYRDNLMSPPPRFFVAVREDGGEAPLSLVGVTVDPMEAEGFAEAPEIIVAGVPMPVDIAHAIAEFVDTHHVERAFVKRKRKRHRDGEGAT